MITPPKTNESGDKEETLKSAKSRLTTPMIPSVEFAHAMSRQNASRRELA